MTFGPQRKRAARSNTELAPVGRRQKETKNHPRGRAGVERETPVVEEGTRREEEEKCRTRPEEAVELVGNVGQFMPPNSPANLSTSLNFNYVDCWARCAD